MKSFAIFLFLLLLGNYKLSAQTNKTVIHNIQMNDIKRVSIYIVPFKYNFLLEANNKNFLEKHEIKLCINTIERPPYKGKINNLLISFHGDGIFKKSNMISHVRMQIIFYLYNKKKKVFYISNDYHLLHNKKMVVIKKESISEFMDGILDFYKP